MKASVYIATSLDGFIARRDGSIDWLDEALAVVPVDGGATIQGFLADSLIDEITITTIPIAIGVGMPLFGAMEKDIKLTHARTTAYDFGFVQTTYQLDKNPV